MSIPHHMETPNIFNYATSELSQDAILAYILTWAHPKFKDSNPELNNLGLNLLKELIKSACKGINKSDLSFDLELPDSYFVGVQKHRLDVYVKVTDQIFLFIEDKTNTFERTDQIEEYKKSVEKHFENSKEGSFDHILPVYLKTGNESFVKRPKEGICGYFYRSDLLKVLDEHKVDNCIIKDFKRHLEKWEEDTKKFSKIPVFDENNDQNWSWAAREGYYMKLGEWLRNSHENNRTFTCDWGYVANPSGGLLAFWWYERKCKRIPSTLYLQINDVKRIQVRVGGIFSRDDKGNKITTPDLYKLLDLLKQVSKKPGYKPLKVVKPKRFSPGQSAAVAFIDFDENVETYLATNSVGALDLDKTKERLNLIMHFMDDTCS